MITTSQKNDLGHIHANAAAYLRDKGWVQGQTEDEHGRVDMTGALQACSPYPGGWAIAATVYRALDRAEDWNDAQGRTEAEVHDWLTHHPITDSGLRLTFGEQWEAVVEFIRRAALLTAEETATIRGYVVDEGSCRWQRQRVLRARRACIEALPGGYGMYDAGHAAYEVAPDAGSSPARATLAATLHRRALALSARHLTGRGGFTEGDYLALTAPWQAAVGPTAVAPEAPR